MRQLADAARVIRAMFGQGPATYDGRHFHVRDALNDPRAVQRPHPPIMIGGSGERSTLRLVARYAQWCNVNGDPARVAGRLDTLREHCRDVGRPIEEITLSNYVWCVIGRDEAEAVRLFGETVVPALRGA